MNKFYKPISLMVVVVVVLSLGLVAMPVSAATGDAILFSDDMEDGTNDWDSSGFWHQIEDAEDIYVYNVGGATPDATPDDLCPDLVTLPDMDTSGHAYLPEANSGDTAWWYGVDELGSFIDTESDFLANLGSQSAKNGGTSTTSNSGNLDSPLIDVAGIEDATLSFWTWWEIEGIAPASYDRMIIYISTDEGDSWTEVDWLNPDSATSGSLDENYSSDGPDSTPVWVEQEYDISSFLGDDVDTIQVRFTFQTGDSQYNGFRGWFIDDVEVTGGCPTPTASISPSITMGEAPLTVQFRGSSNQSGVDYSWSFGTGDDSDSRSPSYTFQNEGTYEVFLTVTNECGVSASDSVTINVEAQNAPPVLVVQDLNISPTYANYGEPVYITATVFNQGGSWGSQDMHLLINGQFEQSVPVGVAAGTGQAIDFTVYKTEAREYQVTIGEATGTFYLMEQAAQQTQSSGLLAGGDLDTGGIIAIICIGVILVAGIILVFLFARRA